MIAAALLVGIGFGLVVAVVSLLLGAVTLKLSERQFDEVPG